VGLGEVSRELFEQFIFRIRQEFAGKQAHLGLSPREIHVNSNMTRNSAIKFSIHLQGRLCMFVGEFFRTQATNPFPDRFLVWIWRNIKARSSEAGSHVLDDDTGKLAAS